MYFHSKRNIALITNVSQNKMSPLKYANIDTQCECFKELKQEDITKLEEWQRKQPHLPSPLHPIETALFLHRCRYSIEAAKQRIEMYYTFRSRCPEFFSHRDPSHPDVSLALGSCVFTALPELTREGYLVFYTNLDRNAEVYNFNAVIKMVDMIIDLVQKQRGCHTGHVGIIDLKGFTISHLLKTNVLSVKKALLHLQKMLPLRVKSLHFVNGVPFMDKVMALVRPFIKKEFPVKVHFGDNSTIFEFVPQNILPIECGGFTFSVKEYYNNVMRKEVERNADYFKVADTQVVDESKRPQNLTNFDDLLGVEGIFKQLNVD